MLDVATEEQQQFVELDSLLFDLVNMVAYDVADVARQCPMPVRRANVRRKISMLLCVHVCVVVVVVVVVVVFYVVFVFVAYDVADMARQCPMPVRRACEKKSAYYCVCVCVRVCCCCFGFVLVCLLFLAFCFCCFVFVVLFLLLFCF